MSDLATDLRRYAERAPTITLDEVSSARGRRPGSRRALAVVAVCCCLGASAVAIVATRNPGHHRVDVAAGTSTYASAGDTPLVGGTVTFEGLQSGDTLPLGTIGYIDATIQNRSHRSLALVRNGAAVFTLTCDNGQLNAGPSRPSQSPFASTYSEPGHVNITPPLAAGASFGTSVAVIGRSLGTMTCRIVVDGKGGWSPIAPNVAASVEIGPATAPTTSLGG